MGYSRLKLKCESVGMSRKHARARATKCTVMAGPKDLVGRDVSINAELQPRALRTYKAKRAKRAAKAKERFSKPIEEVQWKCKTYSEAKNGDWLGHNCKRELEGLGKKKRVQVAKRVVLT